MHGHAAWQRYLAKLGRYKVLSFSFRLLLLATSLTAHFLTHHARYARCIACCSRRRRRSPHVVVVVRLVTMIVCHSCCLLDALTALT